MIQVYLYAHIGPVPNDQVIDAGLYAQIGPVPNDQVIDTGLYAQIGPVPNDRELLMGTWYRSRDTLSGDHPYGQHLLNKKWPLIKEIISFP